MKLTYVKKNSLYLFIFASAWEPMVTDDLGDGLLPLRAVFVNRRLPDLSVIKAVLIISIPQAGADYKVPFPPRI